MPWLTIANWLKQLRDRMRYGRGKKKKNQFHFNILMISLIRKCLGVLTEQSQLRKACSNSGEEWHHSECHLQAPGSVCDTLHARTTWKMRHFGAVLHLTASEAPAPDFWGYSQACNVLYCPKPRNLQSNTRAVQIMAFISYSSNPLRSRG